MYALFFGGMTLLFPMWGVQFNSVLCRIDQSGWLFLFGMHPDRWNKPAGPVYVVVRVTVV